MLVCRRRAAARCWLLVAPRGASVSACKESFRLETIKSRGDISDLFSCGKRLHTPYLTFIVLPTKQHGQQGRVAFIAGKKSGNAVWRNSAKRRMRAICHELGGPWAGYDVIFLAKSGIMRGSYSKVHTACAETLKRAELRRDERNEGISETGAVQSGGVSHHLLPGCHFPSVPFLLPLHADVLRIRAHSLPALRVLPGSQAHGEACATLSSGGFARLRSCSLRSSRGLLWYRGRNN